jgi:hypothetical protein
MDEQQIANTRLLNESAIREHALTCSAKYRANKFTRVGQAFLDEVATDVENLVRNVRSQFPTLHPPLSQGFPDTSKVPSLVTGALREKVISELNKAIARLIQNKVQRQPTVGKTLGRTR